LSKVESSYERLHRKFMSTLMVIKPSDSINYTCSGYQINGSGEKKNVSVFQPCMRVVGAFLTGGLHLLWYVQYVCVQRESNWCS
jgi:hypothetical protein